MQKRRLGLALIGWIWTAAVVAQPALEWHSSDNGQDISWDDAQRYCLERGPGWRLPSPQELMAQFDSRESVRCGWNYCHVAPRWRLSGSSFWSRERDEQGRVLTVNLDLGQIDHSQPHLAVNGRAWCIRTSGSPPSVAHSEDR